MTHRLKAKVGGLLRSFSAPPKKPKNTVKNLLLKPEHCKGYDLRFSLWQLAKPIFPREDSGQTSAACARMKTIEITSIANC